MRLLFLSTFAAFALPTLLSGCVAVDAGQKFGANQVLRFTENNLVPPMLSDNDIGMACASGEAITPLILATGGLGADTDQIGALLYTTAALCAENRSIEEQMRYMRAARSNDVEDAQDARLAQKRLSATAAERQYKAYQRIEHFYRNKQSIELGEKCPAFHKDFDEMVYMLGLIAGMQAIANDTAAQGQVGVPKDIAAKVDRAMGCLSSEKWFGIPLATRAAVWSILPGAGAGKDPWESMKQAMRIGERQGVRLPHALYAMTAAIKADESRLRDAFRSYAATVERADFKENTRFRLVDRMGSMVVQNVADLYWTEHTGTRAPIGGLGSFWDDKGQAGKDEGVQIDDLL